MPPRLAVYFDDDSPADSFEIAGLSGGAESAVLALKIYNDKDASFGDTTTASSILAVLLASIGGAPYRGEGVTILDELWTRVQITTFYDGDDETDDVVNGSTQPWGTNSTLSLPDLAPQQGVRIELQVFPPGGRGIYAARLAIMFEGNRASASLSQHVTLAHGSGVIPPDRIPDLRSILGGNIITADGSDTVVVSAGQQVYETATTATAAEDVTFTINDSAAVALTTGDEYGVTLSRTSAGVLTVTKGLKSADVAVLPPKPAANIYVGNLVVRSADGVAVTVDQADVTQEALRYAGNAVTPGTGLSVYIHPGTGTTSNDLRQYVSHRLNVGVAASSTNRIWRTHDGGGAATATDAPPSVGADLLAYAVTDAVAVTSIIEARRFAHRAVVEWPLVMSYRGALSQLAEPSHGLALAYLDFDGELERVTFALSDTDATWTAGELLADLRWFAPGAPVPFPAGGLGTGGASIYTDDAQRPVIAWDATNLRAVSDKHMARRFAAGTAFLFGLLTTVAAPGAEPEQEVRVTLHFRRYR